MTEVSNRPAPTQGGGRDRAVDPRVLRSLYWLSGALRASARDADVIRFTGEWAPLGEATVGQILDDASALIGDLIAHPSDTDLRGDRR